MIEREEGMGGKNKRGKNERKATVVGNKGQNLKEIKKEKERKEGRKKEKRRKKDSKLTSDMCGLRISVYT